MTSGEMLFWMLVGHAVTDFPLQGDFLAKAKDWTRPMPGVPWLCALLAHALICSAPVYYVSRSWPLAAMEIASHAWLDFCKCG